MLGGAAIQNPKSKIENLKRRLVEGLRVITGEGVLSGSGHLSARIPGSETFLINPRFAGVLADPKDICTVTFEGKRIAEERQKGEQDIGAGADEGRSPEPPSQSV